MKPTKADLSSKDSAEKAGTQPQRGPVISSPAGPTKVAIVEDNAVLRRNLQILLNFSPDFKCVCACADGAEALKRLPDAAPEVVLMDIHLPGMSGIECTAQLKRLLPSVQIIMLTVYEDSENIFRSLRAGACGYLLKRTSPERLLEAVRQACHGGAPLTSEIARKVIAAFQEPAPDPDAGLTPREQEILEWLTRGLSNKEIANQLNISASTVKIHLEHIFAKLHVRSRTEAVALSQHLRDTAQVKSGKMFASLRCHGRSGLDP